MQTHRATDGARDFGAELALKCVDNMWVIALLMLQPSLASNDLHRFTHTTYTDIWSSYIATPWDSKMSINFGAE